MRKLSGITVWSSVQKQRWSFDYKQYHVSVVAFEVQRIPNFSSSRFNYLGDPDSRKRAVAQHQMRMLRQLYALGPGCGFSLRMVRESESRLRFLVLARWSDNTQPSPALVEKRAARVESTFPQEYVPTRVFQERCPHSLERALLLDWPTHVHSLLKPEPTHPANTWPFFYVPLLLEGNPLNDQEMLAQALLRFSGQALVDITLVPTAPVPQERRWVEDCTERMQEALRGECVYGRDGTTVRKRFDAMPGLQAPLENFESLLKRYANERLFLYAIRVLADRDPTSVTNALIASATRSQMRVLRLSAESSGFEAAIASAEAVDIAPEIHRNWWDVSQTRPFRAQRLHRLADLEEIAPFWRLPIPMREQFPGIILDRGLDSPTDRTDALDVQVIGLGTYADERIGSVAATFDREGLTKHGLVVGVPGSGKTTLMFNIIDQLWRSEPRVPFIVLEPVKTEYRALKNTSTFREDLLIFTLGDERTSPFRFNPFAVPDGIPLESHIARLNASFVAAFDLFDPLPMLLDQAIRDIYEGRGWTDLAVGGGPGCGSTPTLRDLHRRGKEVADEADYAGEVNSNIRAALDLRLASLLRGSKGYMLDTERSITADQLMERPVILELDSLNQQEKALLMMFVLTYVYEYAKSTRLSGSHLAHVLVVEEAHNLIGRSARGQSFYRANPREHAIELFVRMLAEMRALGEGILIGDQLPTAIAPEAMKNTNLKVMMRLTAMDDRLEIGNTMGLKEEAQEIEGAPHMPCGMAYTFLEDWDRVRLVRTPNYKRKHGIEQPQTDERLRAQMQEFHRINPLLHMPFEECKLGCEVCDRKTRSAARQFVHRLCKRAPREAVTLEAAAVPRCELLRWFAHDEMKRRISVGKDTTAVFEFCLLLHLWHEGADLPITCGRLRCECEDGLRQDVIAEALENGKTLLLDSGGGSQNVKH